MTNKNLIRRNQMKTNNSQNPPKLYTNCNNSKQKYYFSDGNVYQTTESKKTHCSMILDQNIRFSITKIDKKMSNYHFQLNIRSLTHQIQLKIEKLKDLEELIKYLGNYGYGYGLQSIASQFVEIGKGNFASVYKLVSNYKSIKAMKMFQRKKLQNVKNKLAFLNQIKIMRQLNSPYLASLECIYQTQKSYYLQMQFFQQNLKSYLKKTITKGKQKQIMKDLLSGLAQMKQKNILHRDIKPDNIMVRRYPKNDEGKCQQQFVIIDFGLSCLVQQQKNLHKKCGTPGFIAPEIINMNESNQITTKCDIFSLGVTFFYILTKKKPFSGCDNKEMLNKNKKMIVEEHLFHYMSEKESDLVKKMMQKDPQKRISIKEALRHGYFNSQQDEDDEIPEQQCDLNSKVTQLKILNTSFLSQGIVLLYSLLKSSHYKPVVKQQFTNCVVVDTEFNQLDNSDQQYSS